MISFKSAISRISLFKLSNNRCQSIVNYRLKSAWIKASSAKSSDGDVNVEETFINDKVQTLLYKLTGLNEDKIFAERNVEEPERSHFALMTDSMLEETKALMRERGGKLLQFVPIKEPREDIFTVLSKDSDIADFDTSKFVFTDITFDATNQDRTVVIREPDGTLRTALPEEHDRMNRIYYEQSYRQSNPPAVFFDPDLKNALDTDKHEFVMDYAVWFYEPDDPGFVKLSKTVFDRTIEDKKFELLHSTRHFGSLVYYMVLNNNITSLLNYYGTIGNIHDAANLIRLQKTVFPNWRTEISFQDSDEKIIRDFLFQNRRLKENLSDLMNLLDDKKTITGAVMHNFNTRGTCFISQKYIPYVKQSNSQTPHRLYCSSSFNDKKVQDLNLSYKLTEIINKLERNTEYKIIKEVESLRSEFKIFSAEINGNLKNFEAEINGNIKNFETEINGNIKNFKKDVNSKFLKLFVGIAGIIITTGLNFLFNNFSCTQCGCRHGLFKWKCGT